MGQMYTISFLKKEEKKRKARKTGYLKKKFMYKAAAGCRCIISSMWLFPCVPSKPAPLRRWWIQQCVCPEATVVPLLAKILTFWLLKGSVWKRTKKFTVTFSPWGNERRTVKGRVRDLANSVVLNIANKGRLYSLYMSLPCKLFLNYICYEWIHNITHNTIFISYIHLVLSPDFNISSEGANIEGAVKFPSMCLLFDELLLVKDHFLNWVRFWSYRPRFPLPSG